MAIRQKTTIKVRMTGKGTSHARSESSVRDLTQVIDEPLERGGTNEGLTPTETAFAALIGCTNVIGQKCADKLGVDVGHLTFDMVVDFDRRGVLLTEEVDVPFEAITLTVTSDSDASAADLKKVGLETSKYCAIAKLFQNSGTKLTVNWQKA